MKGYSFALFFIGMLLNNVLVYSQNNWPKEISLKTQGGKITVYQPQPESYSGVKLTGRCAISVRKNSTAEPIFGAMWFAATLHTEKDSRIASLESIKITNARFADSVKPETIIQLNALIESEIIKWNLEISLDELITSVNAEQRINDSALKMDPPKIIYTTKPSTLVFIDGQPNIKMDDKLKMERVINTPFLLFKFPDDGKFYLYAGSFWHSSSSVTSQYSYVQTLPSKLKELDKQIKDSEAKKDSIKPGDRPKGPTEVIIATEPTELIQTEGVATYKVIAGTNLLYADNTLDEIFKDVNTQETFILVSGRWYSAPNLNGPWVFNPSDKLPADFAKIPPGSEKDGVLANVAGTPEAEEAIMEAQIPQTVKVDRKNAKCSVSYDGQPKFKKIENTELEVAENSSITVIRSSDGKYYAVDNGIWFVSDKAEGPWTVANERPGDVEKIPPSDHSYNTKYVYVYESTPEYVYMGYTPGYMGCYVYGPTVVYGTGFYYMPWYGAYYYPRPVTYGFGFSYNPWMGWGMHWGMSFSFGWMSVGFYGGGYYGAGWWGPPMYRPPCGGWGWHGGYYGRPGYGGGGGYQRPGTGTRPPSVSQPIAGAGSGASTRPAGVNNNMYNRREGATTKDVNRNRPTTNPTNRAGNKMGNNVYTDRAGNVFRNDNKGNWQQRNNNTWGGASNNVNRNDLNRSMNQRDRGNMRNNNYRQSYSRPSMGARGGGGGRRR